MFNDLQLLLLQKERSRDLAREWRNDALLREARNARRSASTHTPEQALRLGLLRAFTLVLLFILLAFGLTRIARAQSSLVLATWHNGDRAGLRAAIVLADLDDDQDTIILAPNFTYQLSTMGDNGMTALPTITEPRIAIEPKATR